MASPTFEDVLRQARLLSPAEQKKLRETIDLGEVVPDTASDEFPFRQLLAEDDADAMTWLFDGKDAVAAVNELRRQVRQRDDEPGV